MVGCLRHAGKRIQEAALSVLVHCAPSTVGTAMMLHAGVLPVLLEMLQRKDGGLKHMQHMSQCMACGPEDSP